jgi:hypothetical protein
MVRTADFYVEIKISYDIVYNNTLFGIFCKNMNIKNILLVRQNFCTLCKMQIIHFLKEAFQMSQ